MRRHPASWPAGCCIVSMPALSVLDLAPVCGFHPAQMPSTSSIELAGSSSGSGYRRHLGRRAPQHARHR